LAKLPFLPPFEFPHTLPSAAPYKLPDLFSTYLILPFFVTSPAEKSFNCACPSYHVFPSSVLCTVRFSRPDPCRRRFPRNPSGTTKKSACTFSLMVKDFSPREPAFFGCHLRVEAVPVCSAQLGTFLALEEMTRQPSPKWYFFFFHGWNDITRRECAMCPVQSL